MLIDLNQLYERPQETVKDIYDFLGVEDGVYSNDILEKDDVEIEYDNVNLNSVRELTSLYSSALDTLLRNLNVLYLK